MYNNYEAMETLRYALFCTGPTSAMAAARTASDDSTDHGDQEECFHKDYQQFLDASSDDCQVGSPRVPASVPLGTAFGIPSRPMLTCKKTNGYNYVIYIY